jgi:hypothetical protein
MRLSQALTIVSGICILTLQVLQACTQPGAVGFYWDPNTEVEWTSDSTVSLLPSGTSSDPYGQISGAFSVWENYWLYRCPYITFGPVSEAGANLVVLAGDLGANGPGASQPNHTGIIYSQNITINSNPGSLPLFDASQSAYNTYVFKVMLHELGHVFGLADIKWGAQCQYNAYASIMDQICGTNDYFQGISTVITTCDDTEIQAIYGTCVADYSCPSNDGCSGYDQNGYAIRNPDYCEYNPSMGYYDGCPSGTSFQDAGGNPGMACCWQDGSPIIIDLSGAGFNLTAPADGVRFELNPKGTKDQFSWIAKGARNGWLALDRNGNGTIDSGAELFGNYTPQPPSADPNGFLALALYDQADQGGNGDGQIDARDAIYSKLLVWIDSNHNGISEPGELFHLKDLGIESISLSYQTSKWTDKYGNAFRYKAKIRIANVPDDQWTYDVFLRRAH